MMDLRGMTFRSNPWSTGSDYPTRSRMGDGSSDRGRHIRVLASSIFTIFFLICACLFFLFIFLLFVFRHSSILLSRCGVGVWTKNPFLLHCGRAWSGAHNPEQLARLFRSVADLLSNGDAERWWALQIPDLYGCCLYMFIYGVLAKWCIYIVDGSQKIQGRNQKKTSGWKEVVLTPLYP